MRGLAQVKRAAEEECVGLGRVALSQNLATILDVIVGDVPGSQRALMSFGVKISAFLELPVLVKLACTVLGLFCCGKEHGEPSEI